jgi:NTE family protein
LKLISVLLSCSILQHHASVKVLEAEADDKICNIIHLIYHAKKYEGTAKDYEFSRRTMEEHWQAGYEDAVRTLDHPEVLQRPDKTVGVRTFDFTKSDRQRN